MASATEALRTQAGIGKKPITFQEMLESMRPQIAAALPRFLNPDRMIRIALTSMRLNPKLAECTPDSLLAAIMIASQLGLEPGIRGQAYLVPYFNKASKKMICQLIPGWMGLVGLVHRSGQAQVSAAAVYVGDVFRWQLGSDPKIEHQPSGDESRLTHTYAVGKIKGLDSPVLEVWPIEKIWKHRDKINKVGDSHYSYAWPDQYAKKIPLLQVLKYLPQSIQLSTALSLDDAAETGGQSFEIKDVPNVIEGTLVPEPEAAKPPEDVICGDCGGQNGNHAPGCKYDKPDAGAAEKAQEGVPEPQTASDTPKAPEGHNWARLFASARDRAILEPEIKAFYTKKFKVKSGTELTDKQFAILEADIAKWRGPEIEP